MDWAMKFLQLRYREKQSDWYGNRGLSWHVSSLTAVDSRASPVTNDSFENFSEYIRRSGQAKR